MIEYLETPDGTRYRRSAKKKRHLWRVLSDYELWVKEFTHKGHGQFYHPGHPKGWLWREGMPAVFWLFGGTQVELNRAYQLLIRDDMNPHVPHRKLRIVFDYVRAFSNGLGKGFDTRNFFRLLAAKIGDILFGAILSSDYVPVQDWFNDIDTKGNAPMLRKDKVRVCADAIVSGHTDGDYLVVETLDPNNPPTWTWLKKRIWLYFSAVSTHKDKSTGEEILAPFPQAGDGLLLIPLVANTVVKYPLGALEYTGTIDEPDP